MSHYRKYFIVLVILMLVGAGFVYLWKQGDGDIQHEPVEEVGVEEESPVEETDIMDNSEEDFEDIEIEEEQEIVTIPGKALLEGVPFTSQAPFGNWEDPLQQHGCEEASLLMAHYWILGESLSKEKALEEIIAVSEFEEERFGSAYDLSMADTLKLWQEYFGHENGYVKYDITSDDIKRAIASGNVVVVPINGVVLGNPYYTAPGPEFHEMIIIGYDDSTGEFMTHDPGTRYGENYRYDYDVFMRAIRDYKTGFDEPVNKVVKAMLVIGKE